MYDAKPVYPKENPEYRKRILEDFYKKVRDTNWGEDDKPRGRKAKEKIKPIAKIEVISKFFNYNK